MESEKVKYPNLPRLNPTAPAPPVPQFPPNSNDYRYE